MKNFIVLLLTVTGYANAENTYITMPNEGWTLLLDTPPITSSKNDVKNRMVRYMGSSIETGITISVNSNTDAASSNKECFDTYWQKAQQNPVMVKTSIDTSNNKTAYYASHQSEGEYRGKAFKTANGHAYFVKGGLCIDVHVSHWPFDDDSEDMVNEIIKSLEIIED